MDSSKRIYTEGTQDNKKITNRMIRHRWEYEKIKVPTGSIVQYASYSGEKRLVHTFSTPILLPDIGEAYRPPFLLHEGVVCEAKQVI